MNGYTKTGFVMSKVFGIVITTMYSLATLLMIGTSVFGYFCDEWIVFFFFFAFIPLGALLIFVTIKYFFATYTIDKSGILIKDGFKKELRHISWKECDYIRIVGVTFAMKYGVSDSTPSLPYLVFSKVPVDVSTESASGRKVENTAFPYALLRQKLIMVPMTPQNVEFVQKFFDIDHLLQAEMPKNSYDWQDPKTWGKDQ